MKISYIKSWILFLVLCIPVCLTTPVAAQQPTKEYVNYRFEKVNKAEATMYRLISQNPDKSWQAKYHGIFSDQLIWSIDYKTDAMKIKHGLLRSYQKFKLSEEKEYLNDTAYGNYRKYSREGEVITEGQYQQGSKHGAWTFYRNGKPSSVSDFYHGNLVARTKSWRTDGSLRMEGQTKEGKKEGQWTYYFPSGKKLKVEYYVEGQKEGVFQGWYENDTLEKEYVYLNNVLHGMSKKWNKKGVLIEEGSYENGTKRGIWNRYGDDGALEEKWDYDQRPAKKIFVSENRKMHDQSARNQVEEIIEEEIVEESSDNLIFVIVEEEARPKGGMQEFRKHVSDYTTKNYPERARKAGITGKVFINFTVEKDGTLSNVQILKGIGGGCAEVARNAIKSYGKWIPAKHRGKVVRQNFNFPVSFGWK